MSSTRLFNIISLAFFLGVSTLCASTSYVGDPSGLYANDSVNWSQLGPDGTVVIMPFSAISSNNMAVGVSGPFVSYASVSVVCAGSSPSPGCSWTPPYPGKFNAGDSLLQTNAGFAGPGSGPLTFCFDPSAGIACTGATHGIFGAGAYIQPYAFGPFTAQIQAYDGSTLLLTEDVNSDSNGSPVFLGAFDPNGDITSEVFSLTAITPDPYGDDVNNFAVDSVSFSTATPEPATLFPVLLSMGLLVLGSRTGLIRKFAKKTL